MDWDEGICHIWHSHNDSSQGFPPRLYPEFLKYYVSEFCNHIGLTGWLYNRCISINEYWLTGYYLCVSLGISELLRLLSIKWVWNTLVRSTLCPVLSDHQGSLQRHVRSPFFLKLESRCYKWLCLKFTMKMDENTFLFEYLIIYISYIYIILSSHLLNCYIDYNIYIYMLHINIY